MAEVLLRGDADEACAASHADPRGPAVREGGFPVADYWADLEMRVSARESYTRLLQAPAWWLLDADKFLIGSVRAPTIEEARILFRAAGPEYGFERGRWIRKGAS